MLRQRNHGLKPELFFTIGRLHMDMHSRFFPREEIEAKAA
jgi:hypothetical protein